MRFIRALSKAARFVPESGVYPKGYSVGGIHCGVKKNGAPDLALVTNTHGQDGVAAAVFTKNKFKAAPVQVLKRIVDAKQNKGINLVIVNSGNANAVTGAQGMADAENMVKVTDAVLDHSPDLSLVMLTGVIGQNLPIDNILSGIPKLALENLGLDHAHWVACATALCTTDTFPKLVSKQFAVDGHTYTVAGLCKGAGMICPNMATLLGFFVTDAPVAPAALKKILTYSVDRLFNAISVDGDMSTNDTIVALANGAAGGPVIDVDSAAYPVLEEAVTDFAQQLAQLVVRDGEGATKFIELRVTNALSFEEAHTVANSVANSALFKTAMYGEDANWGRILCAIGYAKVDGVEPTTTNVSFIPADGSARLPLLVNGEPEKVDEERALEILKAEDLIIEIDLGTGDAETKFWTCDFSHEYVTINGDYRS